MFAFDWKDEAKFDLIKKQGRKPALNTEFIFYIFLHRMERRDCNL